MSAVISGLPASKTCDLKKMIAPIFSSAQLALTGEKETETEMEG
jgi:hypothetical protein